MNKEFIAIDGKRIRQSFDTKSDKKAIHMVSAWASSAGLVLGQLKTEEKSNEIQAIPNLLDLLDINDCTVTIDAMGCQKDIVEKIVEKNGIYVIAVKKNQRNLYKSIENLFSKTSPEDLNGPDFDFHGVESEKIVHGRHEERYCFTTSNLEKIPMASEWHGAKTVAVVISRVTVQGKTTYSMRYYISNAENYAQMIATAVRSHWGIENSLHWILDVAFREDDSRIRKGHGQENFAVLRHIAVNLLKRAQPAKKTFGMATQRLKAGWDNDYMYKILFGM